MPLQRRWSFFSPFPLFFSFSLLLILLLPEHPVSLPHLEPSVPRLPPVQLRQRADGTGSGGLAGPDPEELRRGRVQGPLWHRHARLDVRLPGPPRDRGLRAEAAVQQVARAQNQVRFSR